MGVKYILQQAGAKMGLNSNAQSSRTVLLRFANEAAEELYDESDMPGSLMEQAFKVNGDQTISCPAYVGEIRAAREIDSQLPWSINRLRPRYNQFPWKDMFRNLRQKNTQALMATVTNESVGVVVVPVVETPNVVVTVVGSTPTASSITETVVLSALSVNTVNQFTNYTSVRKDRVNTCDVTLTDVDNKVLTVIPNDQLAALYQIIDVSQCPWLAVGTNPLEHYLEILYKIALTQFANDGDEFIAPGYDNIIVNKMLQLWKEEQDKTEDAARYDAKATRSLARKTARQNTPNEDVVALVANPHDSLLPRIRQGRYPRRYIT